MDETLTYERYLKLQRGIRWQEIKGQLQAMLYCYPSTGHGFELFNQADEICDRFIEAMEREAGVA